VAGEASRELVMRLVGVTHTALGDRPFDSGRMSDVAILTGYARLVGSTCSSNVCWRLGMAFDTVKIGECRRGVSRPGAADETDGQG